jgi:hypothetical protein
MLWKWKIIAVLGMSAVGAAASGIAVLLQKLPKNDTPETDAEKPAERKTGSYSFISGYQDAATVELQIDYDPAQFSFAIVEDEFLNDTCASHVAIIYGLEFNLQFEYASYGNGEDFAAHSAALREKYQTCGEVCYGALTGLWVQNGDSITMHFPLPGDAQSYLIVTAQKTPDYKDELCTLPNYAPLRAMLESARITRS